MKTLIVQIASLVIDVALRTWMKDEKTYIVNNVLDVERLAMKLGCEFFERGHLETNLKQCINNTSEKIFYARFLDGIEEQRAKQIVKQIIEDIEKIDTQDEKFFQSVMMGRDIVPGIIKNSERERMLWCEREIGAYQNCVRFASDAIVKFASGLPTFSSEALKILYRRNEVMWSKFEKQLEEICTLLKGNEWARIEYKEFQIDYLRKVTGINSKVQLFGSGISKRMVRYYDLSTSYIELYCEGVNDGETDYEIEISDVFNYGNIVWIGGEAGGGKTTFLQWLATCAATKSEKIETIKGLVPIVLKLREIDFPINYKKEIEKITNSPCPKGWIEYLFNYDKVLLLFDGLDEICEENRNKVYEEIEQICKAWQIEKKERKSKIVVTSRMYVEDELECEHCFFEIMRMKMPNISKFVKYWHNTILKDISEEPDKINEYSQNVIDNITKSQSLRTISGTPLLCAMICALGYLNNKIIPTNKLELYDKCCHMLVSERDIERHIKYSEKIDILNYFQKERILEDMAYYMMNAEKAAMAKKDIVDHLKAFLKDSTLVQDPQLRENPEILVDYLVRRTGIIREMSMGTIDFVHKTFLEYIASKAIIRKNEFNIIPLKSNSNFWKETIVMCFGQLSRENATCQLKELLELYERTKNIEYVFMASLCARETSDIEIVVDKKIEDLISTFIPPQKEYISQLSKVGDIIVPFLYNKDTYSDRERHRCLTLLNRLLINTLNSEITSVVYSYVDGPGNQLIGEYAIVILSYCPLEWLDEHCIREKTSEWFLKQIAHKNKVVLTDKLMSLLLTDKVKGKLKHLNDVTIVFSKEFDNEMKSEIDSSIFREFGLAKKLTLENIVTSYQLEILKSVKKLEEICIKVLEDTDIILDRIKRYNGVKNIKTLSYFSKNLLYVCDNDLIDFTELENAYLQLESSNIEMQITGLNFNANIEKIHIALTEEGYWANEEKIYSLALSSDVVEVTTIKDDKSWCK